MQVSATPRAISFLSILQQLLVLGDMSKDDGGESSDSSQDTEFITSKWEIANRMLQRIVQARNVGELEDACRASVTQLQTAIENEVGIHVFRILIDFFWVKKCAGFGLSRFT